MAVIQMSDRELTRLRVMIDLADGRLTVETAATLMCMGRRQVFRLRRAFEVGGPSALVSRKRGRPSNRMHGHFDARSWLWFGSTTRILVRRSLWRSWPSVMVCVSVSRHFGNG
jgi:hypothetical protein